MFKYNNVIFTPVEVDGGYLLKADKSKNDSPRVLFVNEKGVYECARDGSNTPLELIDCGDLTRWRVKASLGDKEAAGVARMMEVGRRAKMLDDAAKKAVDDANKAITAAAEAAKGEATK